MQNCIAPRKSLQGTIWFPLCRQPGRGVCIAGKEVRGRYVNDIDGPVEGAANIFYLNVWFEFADTIGIL